MKEWSHEELHQTMDSTPQLKKLSDYVHGLPKAQSWEDAVDQKKQMIVIFAQAGGCQQIAVAQEAVREVFVFFQTQYVTFENYTNPGSNDPSTGRAIREISDRYRRKHLCHSPLGNNYLCFCTNPEN